jgi:hypothetical protein
MRIGVTLEEKVKSTLKDAARKLTGPKKRAFMAKVTEDYFDGSARKAETYLGAHRAHLTTCLWMVAALIQRGEVNLTRWLPYLPCRGNQAQSKQRRVSRWLHNSRINVHRLYKPLIQSDSRVQ